MKKLAICLSLGLFASTASAASLTCQKPIEYLHSGAWERSCQYEGSSLQEAYQIYRIVNPKYLPHSPQILPNENVRFTLKSKQPIVSNRATKIRITWHDENHVSVQEEDNGLVKITFRRKDNVIHIKEVGMTP